MHTFPIIIIMSNTVLKMLLAVHVLVTKRMEKQESNIYIYLPVYVKS